MRFVYYNCVLCVCYNTHFILLLLNRKHLSNYDNKSDTNKNKNKNKIRDKNYHYCYYNYYSYSYAYYYNYDDLHYLYHNHDNHYDLNES